MDSCPEPDETHAGPVFGIDGASSFICAAHLHGKPDDLHRQDDEQDEEVPVAGEERFHRTQ